MKYSELIKLFGENPADDLEIDEILKGNDVIKALFPQQNISLDAVKQFLENDKDGKQYLQSYGDKRVSTGIETFKEKTMPTLINDAVLKATGKKKTPEQIKMEELEKKFNESEAKRIKSENTGILKDKLTEAGLDPLKAIEFFSVDNMENIDKAIGNFKAYMDEGIKAGVEEKIKAGNYTPPGEELTQGSTYEDVLKMMD